MGKISKRNMQRHSEAMRVLEQDTLSFDDKVFVLENYHEGATNMNNLVSAHFTPMSIARSVEQCTRNRNFVDLCAGIGMLTWHQLRILDFEQTNDFVAICVENCTEYYNIGKKLMPEVHWINGSIFDEEVIQQIKDLMDGKSFSVISNPPYGRQVNPDVKHLLKYKGSEFEYKAAELGFLLGANEGVFLIPQGSCNFKMSGQRSTDLNVPCSKYEKFYKQTGIEMSPNIGFCTDVTDEDGWKDVSIATEIAIFDYDEIRENMEEEQSKKIIVPYTNGVDQEVKGYVDLTEIIDEAVNDIENNDNEQLSLF